MVQNCPKGFNVKATPRVSGGPRMSEGARDVHIHSSPAVAANAEGDEIEVLESTDVLPVAPEDVSDD